MAKATVTIQDAPEGLGLSITFDPPLSKGQKPTYAQKVGAELAQAFIEAIDPSAAKACKKNFDPKNAR